VALDANLQAPARLTLMTTLTAVSKAEFSTLRDHLPVSDSLLSKHVSALAKVDYVSSRKGPSRSTYHLDRAHRTGRAALSAHVATLRQLIAGVD
jgi:DNA-binding IscR family transcriptional regulator